MNKLLYKIILFTVFIFLAQIIVYNLMPEKREFKAELKKLNSILDRKIDVLGFGSSIIKSIDPDDKDQRSIFECLADSTKGFNVSGISGFAFQMDLFSAYTKYIFKHSRYSPKLLIVELNLRSFSTEWDLRPEYQFEYEKLMLGNPFLANFYHPLSVLKYFQKDFTRDFFLNSDVNMDGKVVGKVKDFLKVDKIDSEYLKKQYLFHYLYKLNMKHRKIQSMIDIMDIAAQHGSKVLFYITPIDFKTGEFYWPGQFDKILSSNISIFRNCIKDHGGYLMDLSNTITKDYFSYGQTPEHLKQEGRHFVAQKLTLELHKILEPQI